MEMDRVRPSADAQSLVITQVVKRSRNVCILILSAAATFPHIERNVKLENNIREKTAYLFCMINDVINYSFDKMLFVSLNLNEYRIPISTVSV